MNLSNFFGIILAAGIVLLTIYLYNRFSGGSIADLGKK